MAPGGGEAQGKIEGCCPRIGGAGDQVSWTLPFSRRMHEKSVQGQAQPPGSGVDSVPPGWGGPGWEEVWRQPLPAGGSECNRDSTMMGDRERAKKVDSQVKRPRGHLGAPWAGSSLQVVRCWESPQPHSSPETKAGGCKVWQYGLQVLVSIHHPGQPLGIPWPLCLSPTGQEGGRPSSHLCLPRSSGP